MYMCALYMLTFMGEPKDHHVHEHAHESGPVMTVPLILLADPGGARRLRGLRAHRQGARLRRRLRRRWSTARSAKRRQRFHFDVPMAIISTVLVLGGLAGAMYYWAGAGERAAAMQQRFPFIHRVLATSSTSTTSTSG